MYECPFTIWMYWDFIFCETKQKQNKTLINKVYKLVIN